MTEKKHDQDDPLGRSEDVISAEVPTGVDRRTFFMRSAVIGATAVITGIPVSAQQRAKGSTAPPPKSAKPTVQLSPELNVVKQQKGPVMTTVDEFYKVGPGPSSSHTIGPMRITYDFYQRCHQTAGRQTRQGDEASGEPVRQPQRDRQGTRHGTRRARGAGRERAGNGRPEISRQPARQA